MGDEYTPLDHEVRARAIAAAVGYLLKEDDVAAAEYDRWLAAHDEQVRREERERIAAAIEVADYSAPDWSVRGHALVEAARIAREATP